MKVKKPKPKKGTSFSPFYKGPDTDDKDLSKEDVKLNKTGFVKE